MAWVSTVADALLTSTLMFGVLTIFFITYISTQETKAYRNEIDKAIRTYVPQALGDHSEVGPILAQIPFNQMIASAQLEEESNPSRVNNRWVFRFMIAAAVLLLCLYVLYVGVIKISGYSSALNLSSHMFTTVFIIILIGVVEVLFFINVASKFVPTPPSLLVDTVINKLREGV